MLDPDLVREVKRLLAEGKLTQRAIVRRLPISRGSVGNIATGKRPDYESLRLAKQTQEAEWKSTGVKVRCRCCHLRRGLKLAGVEMFRRPDGAFELKLELQPEDLERYEKVHARKAAAEGPPKCVDEQPFPAFPEYLTEPSEGDLSSVAAEESVA